MSAGDTDALMDHFAFAKNENVRWEDSDKGGSVALDVVFNEDKARALAKVEPSIGKVLDDIDAGKRSTHQLACPQD